MNRRILLMLTVLLAVVVPSMTSCTKYKDIKVTSTKVDSFKLDGLKAADIRLSVGVDNPAGKIEILELSGDLKHSGKVVGKVVVDPFIIIPRKAAKYNLKMRFSLADGVGIKTLLSLLDIKDWRSLLDIKDSSSLINLLTMGSLTMDVSVVGKVAGIKAKRSFEDIPMKKLKNK